MARSFYHVERRGRGPKPWKVIGPDGEVKVGFKNRIAAMREASNRNSEAGIKEPEGGIDLPPGTEELVGR
jgi:hypothetical protein